MKKLLKMLKKPNVLRPLLVVIVSVLLTGGIYFYVTTESRVSIENSLISAPVTVVTSTMPGVLKEVYVTEGQQVAKGDKLATVGTTVVYAFSEGVVTEVDKQIGSVASTSTPIVKLVDKNEMRVDGALDENKGLDRIKVGQVVSFTVDALAGKTFWGYVDEVSPTAKQTQAAFSISSERPTQQFEVFAHFDTSANPTIKNGMSAKMTVFTK
jgi:multidrug resistance efflux pump